MWRRILSPVLAAALVAGAVLTPVAATTAATRGRPGTQAQPAPVAGRGLAPEKAKPDPSAGRNLRRPDTVAWPVASGKDARVQVLGRDVSRRLGVAGPVMRVRGGEGAVTVPYGAFSHAYGGDWAARLRFVRLPACALTTPAVPACRTATPLASSNDTGARTVSTKAGAGSVLALEAGDASAQGDYKATKVSPSSSWTTDLSSGGFSWSYPVRTPDVPGKLAPQIAVGYSSQAVDGRTSITNNQGSWVGEGFAYEPGFIERRYKPCADDGHAGSAEQCWAFQNAVIVMGGRSGALVKVDDNTWKLANDDGSKIERLTGAANGDNDGEHWKMTTTDGTQYFFGLNRLPGWAAGKEETESAWTATVYGDDAGEPCNLSSFANSHCDQAWHWNLDHVIDPRGNVISYFYDKEINHYARGGRTDVNGTAYVRGGYLTRIDYGQRQNQVYSSEPAARVEFTTAERCIPSGSVDCDPADLNADTANAWPDVPYDLICAPNTHCKAIQSATTFFTRKRLTRIETQIRRDGAWKPVESWALDHVFKSNNDGSRTLWLEKIQHSGHWGGAAITSPAVEFGAIQLDNRVDSTTDGIGPLTRYRLHTVKTGTGSQLTVSYAPANCDANSLPAPGSSTKRCYPVVWNPFGGTESNEVTDWFHKYVVDTVAEDDLVGGNPDMVWTNEYVGGAAWAKAKPDGITKAKYLSWSDWRGYGQVTVRGGDGQSMPAKAGHHFLRGLGGTVQDSTGRAHADSDGLAGHELETIVYDGTEPVSKSIAEPWRHVTHTQTESWGTRQSAFVRTGTGRNLTVLSGDAWRENTIVTSYDETWGRPVAVDDLSAAGDRCTRTTYADNPARHMYSHASRVQTVSVKCATAPNLATQLLADTRTSYDLAAWGMAPSAGVPTRVETLDRYDGTAVRYTGQYEVTAVDAYGRTKSVKDSMGRVTTSDYVETNGLTTQVTATNPLSHVTVTTQDQAYGVPTAIVDPNGRRQDRAYDSLGRLSAVWLPDRNKALGADPSVRYSYLARDGKPLVVTTETPMNDGTYRASHELFDGLLRSRQRQVPGRDGWLVTDTLHNGTGQVATANAPYLVAEATPGDVPITVPEGGVNGQTIHGYDGAGRKTVETFAVAGAAKWSTRTEYRGDRVVTTPPDGGVPTTTVSDERGKTTEIHQADGVTKYTHTAAGLVDTVTDPQGNTWNYDYDQRGQKALFEDPDSGDSRYTYDAAKNVTSFTDGRGIKLSYKYDALGRRTETWRGEIGTGTKLTTATYDTKAKGQLYSTARHTPSGTYYVSNESLDKLYRPLTTRYWIPGADVGSTGATVKYDFTTEYNADGTVRSVGMPAAGNLPAETVVTGYDDLARPTALTGASSYVTSTSFGNVGEMLQAELYTGGAAKKAWLGWEYERGSGRLSRYKVDRQDATTSDVDASYRYDHVGNVHSIADTPAGGSRDVQCFTYDDLRRMTQAWTSDADSCAGGPGATGVGGPAPYRHSWTFDKVGNRKTETVHGLGGAADTVRRYTYPEQGQGQNQPHAVTQIDETGGQESIYVYDAAGNTSGRPDQALTWDAEGHLATSTPAGGSATSYTYDAAGNRLARREPQATTVYLPGMELRHDKANGSLTGTRYYAFAGRIVAVRTGGGVHFQAADHHGTKSATINASTGQIATRRTTPYGAARGTPPATWPDDRGFIGATQDATGLTHIGAREYDQELGRFVSADPVIVLNEPQQMNGYSYGNANPVTMSDPSGACLPEYCGSPEERLPKEEEKRCTTMQSASECESSPAKDPNRIILATVYPRGTLLVILANGTVIINGYVLPAGVKDPQALAAKIDRNIDYRDIRSFDQLRLRTMNAVNTYCNPQICTLNVVQQSERDRIQLLGLGRPSGMVGFCVGGGGSVVSGGGGVNVCLVEDADKGYSVLFSPSAGPGIALGIAGYGGVGLIRSNGTAEQQGGMSWMVTGTVGAGPDVSVSHAYNMGHSVHSQTVLLGGGMGVSLISGPGYTWVWDVKRPW